ncbi:liprin-beta-2-like [Scophthalmus maximus]|uniref:liprin-beta-2-like n=1 Tax=Scophthalmus maximus TaxID=52904 RepID=UPI001FA8A4B7|nr:liprin-beta-2-like [Scophthalmus maximus]
MRTYWCCFTTWCVAMASNASHMLEAALEQMDDIIAGKIGEGLFSSPMHLGGQDNQSFECSQQQTLPSPVVDPALKTLQLTEALRAVLEGKWSKEEQVSLRKQVPRDTANVILKWLERDEVSTSLALDSPYDIGNIQNPIKEKGLCLLQSAAESTGFY